MTKAAAAALAIQLGMKIILDGQKLHVGPVEEVRIIVGRAQQLVFGGIGLRRPARWWYRCCC